MAEFRLMDRPTEVFTAANKSGGTLAKGDAVKFTTGGVTTAGDGDTVDGFLTVGAANNDYVTLVRGEVRLIGKCAAAFAPAVGASVVMAAGQELDAGTTADKAAGTVVGEAPESGGWVEFRFDPFATVTI